MAIVEFIMYGTNKYFRSRFQKIQPSLNDNNILFVAVVTNYMMDKAGSNDGMPSLSFSTTPTQLSLSLSTISTSTIVCTSL
jgi:hypothetical protein